MKKVYKFTTEDYNDIFLGINADLEYAGFISETTGKILKPFEVRVDCCNIRRRK